MHFATRNIARTLAGGAGAPAAPARRGFVTVIHQAEVAYREFLGRNRVRLEPGLRLCLPVLHALRRVDLREAMVDLRSMNGYTKDNVPVTVSGTLFYRVTDPERACFGISNYRGAVAAAGEAAFRAVLGSFEYDDIIAQRNELNAALMHVLGSSTADWGVVATRFELQDFGPQNRDVARQLEKQMEAERARRENELNTKAAVRTAEGEKAAAILRSEGQKAAAILESEGELAAARNRADGVQYEMQTRAAALTGQVRALAAALQAEPGAAAAASLLVELQRLEHLRELAASPNRVYMLPGGEAAGGHGLPVGLAAASLERLLEPATKASAAPGDADAHSS